MSHKFFLARNEASSRPYACNDRARARRTGLQYARDGLDLLGLLGGPL